MKHMLLKAVALGVTAIAMAAASASRHQERVFKVPSRRPGRQSPGLIENEEIR